jgi:chromosome segregation ATPase
MSVPLQQMLDELRKAEQAQALLSELERRLSAGNADLENLLRQLEQLEQSLPEPDPIRLLIEEAVGAARTRDSIKAGSDVSRSRSAIEGEISSLRGAIQGVQARPDL